MIPPMADPPSRKTTHGATMSPRLSRLYTWLQANGVSLTEFSTDNCVQRWMPQLERLRDELDELIAHENEHSPHPNKHLRHLATDLGAIMRRVPSARVAPVRR